MEGQGVGACAVSSLGGEPNCLLLDEVAARKNGQPARKDICEAPNRNVYGEKNDQAKNSTSSNKGKWHS